MFQRPNPAISGINVITALLIHQNNGPIHSIDAKYLTEFVECTCLFSVVRKREFLIL